METTGSTSARLTFYAICLQRAPADSFPGSYQEKLLATLAHLRQNSEILPFHTTYSKLSLDHNCAYQVNLWHVVPQSLAAVLSYSQWLMPRPSLIPSFTPSPPHSSSSFFSLRYYFQSTIPTLFCHHKLSHPLITRYINQIQSVNEERALCSLA